MSCFNCKNNNKQKQIQVLQQKVDDLNKKISELEKSLSKKNNKDLNRYPELVFND